MKITNWCRKLSAAFVAGSLLVPCMANAASLGTNLVVNSGFENVDMGTIGSYGSVKLLNWTNGTSTGFAYNYSQLYDLGGPLAGGGMYYFTANGGEGVMPPPIDNVESPGEVTQRIDVSTGATAAAIAAGLAKFDLNAFFTSYSTDGDIGNIELRFVNASNVGISAVVLSDPNPLAGWKQASKSGSVPVGTASLLVSLYGTVARLGGGPDGYIDNVNLSITAIPEPSTVAIAGIGLATAGLSLRRRRDQS
jgi:PEP-CTERM motif